MTSFGTTTKNPPWARAGAPTLSSSVAQANQLASQLLAPGLATATPPVVPFQQPQPQQQVYQQAITLQQNAVMAQNGNFYDLQPGLALPTSLASSIGTPGVALPTSLATTQVATVSYPTPRALQPTAFQQQPQVVTAATAVSVPPSVVANQQAPKQRIFTGAVTKVHDNFGFIDEDVFFQTSCVKGTMPKPGDRVVVEATYNPNMPFKWNATRLQVLQTPTNVPMQRSQGLSPALNQMAFAQQNTYNAVPIPEQAPGFMRPAVSVSRHLSSIGSQRAPRDRMRRDNGRENRNVREPKESREREDSKRERNRDDKSSRDRDKERDHRISPSSRKRSRSPRQRSRSPPRRRQRTTPRYSVQIPKISLDLREANVVELRRRYTNLYIPSDYFCTSIKWLEAFPADIPFVMDRPCSFHIMHKEVDPVLGNDAILEPPDADYLYSAKVMLLSLPTQEELFRRTCSLAEDDGDDRENFVHPTRMINFLVGLRGKSEAMAIGGPWSPSLDGPNPEKDPSVLIKTAVRTCKALTSIDLGNCTQWYRFLEIYYRRAETTHKGRTIPARVETVVLFLPDVWSCVPTRLEWDGLHLNYKKQLARKQKADPETTEDEKEESEPPEETKEPTHYSELDPKCMKVNDLRQELEARSLNSKGLKSQLIARLTKVIKSEAEKDDEEEETPSASGRSDGGTNDGSSEQVDEKKVKEEEKFQQMDEKERQAFERRYVLPDNPHILVHASRSAKSGKFDCTVMSLSLLLDYRQEDTKEHSFEVSLFAELFNEMLMRDFGFRIYRTLVEVKEEKEEKDKKSRGDKKEDNAKDDKKDEESNEKKEDKKSEDKDKSEEEEENEEEEEDDKKDKRKKSKAEKTKMQTVDRNLLLACVYFDLGNCGYIQDKDVEDIIYTLGLHLSRAQVRKLVQKQMTKDSFQYRKLTDKPVGAEGDAKASEESEAKSSIDLAELALGNKHLLPVFESRTSQASQKGGDNLSEKEGFVMYRGSLLDVEKLKQQLQRSERTRLETEEKMTSMKTELAGLTQNLNSSLDNAQQLLLELNECKSNFQRTGEELVKVKEQCSTFLTALKEVETVVQPVIASAEKRDDAKMEIDQVKEETKVKKEKTDN